MYALQPKFIRIKDATRVYSVSRTTIYRLAARGVLTIHKPATRLALIEASELERVIRGE
jgi:excisionase family DNA binding protein